MNDIPSHSDSVAAKVLITTSPCSQYLLVLASRSCSQHDVLVGADVSESLLAICSFLSNWSWSSVLSVIIVISVQDFLDSFHQCGRIEICLHLSLQGATENLDFAQLVEIEVSLALQVAASILEVI